MEILRIYNGVAHCIETDSEKWNSHKSFQKQYTCYFG